MKPKPVGRITRGTTAPNRLRRIDRWILNYECSRLRAIEQPIVVDLGYGATPITAVELRDRLHQHVSANIEVVGIEIDPARVAEGVAISQPRLDFRLGGFEVPLPEARSPIAIRAFNVLRQYDEPEVAGAWNMMVSRLQPGGVLVEGTCDEIGRISSWIAVTAEGPQTLTIALKLDALSPDSATAQQYDAPSVVAERLPKALIHHNVAGEPIHDYLVALDRAWQANAALGAFGANQRWIATAAAMRDAGWPIIGGKSRWRLGELTVAYEAVSPHS
mgnify:CR=1 FL=1